MFRVSFGRDAIEISQWSGPAEARDAVTRALEVVNEYGAGQGVVYVLSKVIPSSVGGSVDAFGIQMDSVSEIPCILGVEWGDVRWVGANSSLYVISRSMKVLREIDLESKFSDFRLMVDLDRLIVVAETALFSLRRDFSVDWRVDLDVITDVRWQGEDVMVSQMDASSVLINLGTGELRPSGAT